MSQDITMFVLAAGLGSRYGGLKQMEGFGPSGETIIDYSIYDAIKAGFNKIVFVIRPDMEEAFKEVFLDKYQNKIKIEYCFQTLDMLPSWYELNPERTKPWGTTHALLVSKELIDEPFIVINGDDFYGQESFQIAADFLRNDCDEKNYGIVGYPLKNVMSDIGTVKRGLCSVDGDGFLRVLEETFDVKKDKDGVINGITWDGEDRKNIDKETLASMNMFCFHTSVLDKFQKEFDKFLKENEDDLTGEYIMAVGINNMVRSNKAKIKVLNTPSQWFGVTNPEDGDIVRKKIKELIDNGDYPANLWD